MLIRSIYPLMERSASLLPDDINIKLIFRHSFRPSLQGVAEHAEVRLNQKGVDEARKFGKSIEYPFGELHSSIVPRCIETLESMLYEREEIRAIHISRDVLSDVFATDRREADISFKELGSLKQIVKRLQDGIPLAGFRVMDDCVSMILDYIFSTGNQPGKLDLYCTHDLQLAMLVSSLFSPGSSLKKIESEWPNMLEGMFLWGIRSDFVCTWRGRVERFKNFLL